MNDFLNTDLEEASKNKNIKSYQYIYHINNKRKVKRWLIWFLLIFFVLLFLPWTQNIRAKGNLTTPRQEDRPQELNSIIPGKVVKWYVQEGDYVNKGDTILQLGEIKVEYFDPFLLERTQDQINAKKQSINAYNGKAQTAGSQLEALENAKNLKLLSIDNKIGQQRLKIASDSVDLIASTRALDTYKRQITGAKVMLDSGAISLIDFEKRTVNFQDGIAKVNSIRNKLAQSRQEFLNLRIERNGALQEYLDKIAKTQGERFSSISDASSSTAEVSKLENILSNYDVRRQLYYITAPQSGQITKAKKGGIGELLKEGEMIVEIVPQTQHLAVEMFINPMDLPLVNKGQKVRFVFDGFPAIVFSGWPDGSYGTFGGVISAVETSISPNGLFRVLVIEDIEETRWPKALKIGGGVNGIALLKDVPVWYELWRTISGFPPEYYIMDTKEKKSSKK